MIYKYYINTGQFINLSITICSEVYTLFQKSHLSGKSRFFKNHNFCQKSTLFWTNPGFSKITTFVKNHNFWTNHGFSKITTFVKNHNFWTNHEFWTKITPVAHFYRIPCFFKTSVFFKKFPVQSPFWNSPFDNM